MIHGVTHHRGSTLQTLLAELSSNLHSLRNLGTLLLHLELKHLSEAAACLRIFHLELRYDLAEWSILVHLIALPTTGIHSLRLMGIILDPLRIFLFFRLRVLLIDLEVLSLSDGVVVHALHVAGLLKGELSVGVRGCVVVGEVGVTMRDTLAIVFLELRVLILSELFLGLRGLQDAIWYMDRVERAAPLGTFHIDIFALSVGVVTYGGSHHRGSLTRHTH